MILKKASSKRHAIPGCGTIRISKPCCFLDRGEGLAGRGEEDWDSPAGGNNERVEEAAGSNGWIYCAFVDPATYEERAGWREVMPSGYDTLSPIRRPWAFARALAAMAAEQAGPRGQTVLLRSTVDEQAFCTAHRSQTVCHGPVVYADDPVRRLEGASSDLELVLLLVFLKHAAYRAQREYRFVVWAEKEPEEDRIDLRISPALFDAMQRRRQEPAASGFVSASVEESSTVEALAEVSRPSERIEVLPAPGGPGNPTVASRRYDVERLPGDQCERTTACAALDALRDAVAKSDAACRKDAAAEARHAEPIVRFFCSAFGDGLAGVRVSDDNSIVITGALPGNGSVEASIPVRPDGNCARKISAGDMQLASTAPGSRSFERILKSRLADIGVHGQDGPVRA